MKYNIEWEGSFIPLHYNNKTNNRDCETRKTEMEKNFKSDTDFFYDFRGGRHDILQHLSQLNPNDITTPVYSSLACQLNDWVMDRIYKAIDDNDFHNKLTINDTLIEPHMKIMVNSEPCSFYDLPSEAQRTIAFDMLDGGLFRGKFDYEGNIDIPVRPEPDTRGYEYEGKELTVSYTFQYEFKENYSHKKSESEYYYSINPDMMDYSDFNHYASKDIGMYALSNARKEELKNLLQEYNSFHISADKADLFTSGELRIYDSDDKIIHWDDLSKNVKSAIIDNVFDGFARSNTIKFTLSIPETTLDVYDIAITDIKPDKLDPDFLTGVFWVGNKDFDFDYCKSTGDIYFHNYDYSAPTYSGYKEFALPSYFENEETLEMFEDEVDIACSAHLNKDKLSSLEDRLAAAEERAVKSASSKSEKAKDELEL